MWSAVCARQKALMIDSTFSQRLASKLDEYLDTVRCMVECWFKKEAYEAAAANAASIRALLAELPELMMFTIRTLCCHDSLVVALWRSSSQASAKSFAAVRETHARLCATIAELRRAPCLVACVSPG